MKAYLTPNLTFTPAARTIDFANLANFDVKKLIAVIHLPTNTVIYAGGGNSGLGFSSLSGTILTLQYDTTAMSSSDSLQVLYDMSGNGDSIPADNENYLPVRPVPQQKFRTTFAKVLASGTDTNYFNTLITGSGQTVSQSGGNLVMTSGTTANSETIIRSIKPFFDSFIFRYQATLSQRIANNNFFVELVDVIGDDLALTVNSATSISVTIPGNTFDSTNVGQSMYVGDVIGVAGAVPGRYAIASVAGNVVTFTVAGWPASGSGTVSLFGWNYHQAVYNGTTATAVNYDAQRRGWNTGQSTLSINTTASPGHMGIMTNEDGSASYQDQLIATSTTVQVTQRATRVTNLPEPTTPLYIQIRSLNGTSAPASTTTFTVGMISLENYAPQAVTLHSFKPLSFAHAMPMNVTNTVNTSAALPNINGDVTSAAITTTATTSAISPTFGMSYSVNIPVTSVSGTSPTMDVSIEESDDSGTNWYKVYDFPRITATGAYRSPIFRFKGNRVRYVQTLGGTTPSFTRSINRIQGGNPGLIYVQLIDRTIVPNTLNSTSASILSEGCNDYNLVVLVSAQTTAATINLQASGDGANWDTIAGSSITTAVGQVRASFSNVKSKFVRAIVTAAGTGITLTSLTITGSEN